MSLIALLVAVGTVLPAEFDPKSKAWDGLSYMGTTAAEASVDLVYTDELDWSSVSADDQLIVLHPTDALGTNEFQEFVYAGGRAIVLVDKGAPAGLVEAFGLTLVSEAVIHDNYYRNHPAFPTLTPDGKHFLWFNVDNAVLNHPAALTEGRQKVSVDVTPVIPFAEPGQYFAMEVSSGDGKVLFISDASILINDMQQGVYGDKQLVANILRYYTADRPLLFLLPGTRGTGVFQQYQDNSFPLLERSFARAVNQLHLLLGQFHGFLSSPSGMPATAWFFCILALILLLALPFPGQPGRPGWQLYSMDRPRPSVIRARAVAHGGRNADYTASAGCLKRWYMHELRQHLMAVEFNPVTATELPPTVTEAIIKRAGPAVATLATSCTEKLARAVPGSIEHNEHRQVLALADFQKLWNDCELVIGALKPGE